MAPTEGHQEAAAPLAGRYRLEQVIGRGGMSVVHRAWDESLDRPVAVKLFHPGIVDIARQEAEQGVLASLDHHNLVSLLDAGVVEDQNGSLQRFIVMALVHGQDLEERLSLGPLASRHIAEIGYDMAEALDYIHAQGVVHRDIKPSNILLVDYGNGSDRARARLTDFGIALAAGVERLTADGVTTGTAAYLSPEQARGADVGPASDVYSLGLVLLQCFTRRREFPGSLVESALARLSRDPVVPEPLPDHWKQALAAMTAQDPAARPVGAELVALLRHVVLTDTASDEPADVAAADPAAGRAVAEAASGSGSPPASGSGPAPASGSASGEDDGRPTTLDVLPEEALQRTTAMAARLFDAPIALIEVLDEDREWSQSYVADGVDKSARSITFRNGFAPVPVPVVIPDGSTHPEMRNSPLVTGPLGIRFYVSVPLVRHDGATVGTLAVLDSRPRTADEADMANLRDLAALAVTQLELRQESLRTGTSDAVPIARTGSTPSGRPQSGGPQTGGPQAGGARTGGARTGGRHSGDVRAAPEPDRAG
ncbi:GAF domain-containing serine/threonine-protein kinase [Curtobacterium sp. MCSS17_015]|uniref:protein kinase domain-containing protein n=1 Tax=Curtobacterium sp. MCSS17_015 TaxID=2175666 RepID=UPI000DA89121|nr:GAF domain-containing serine/threonine-protein kinase [Curtobacterium sp. MCSS17_015]WIB26806.1 GAF domain-containing serine/threonine-protein kinase [Curtobacterium sp. MCSS17_015]